MMKENQGTSRRGLLQAAGAAGVFAFAGSARAADEKPAEKPSKVFRIGVVSAAIHGKPQPRNGHTWHFAQYLHPKMDLDAMQKHYPQAVPSHKKYYRNPNYHFDQLPFPDTTIAYYYDADPTMGEAF